MTKNYIKMNNNKNYLSLGNVFNAIKDVANNKSSVVQLEIFCALFNVDDINNTTVNNYCIGYRAISLVYKQIYIDLLNKYKDNYEIFIDTILSLLNILDERIYKKNDNSLELINSNNNLKKLCNNLLLLAINDEHIDNIFIDKVTKLQKNNLYECIIMYLEYAIIKNQQPLYIREIMIKTNKKEIEEYLKVKLYEGISYITSLQELARKNNMYASAELGSLEFDGLINGYIDYNKCFEYYLRAANKDHPKGCLMVANLILTKKVDNSLDFAWKYLERAVYLGNVAAINTMGNCYLKGLNPTNEKNVEKAISYYKEASELGYVYAFNNLGKIYEKESLEEAIKYYKISADLKESWALNKVGEYYRLKGDMDTAYIYYKESADAPISERNYYSYYNLAKYYYLNTDKEKAYEYLKIANLHGIKEAKELLK